VTPSRGGEARHDDPRPLPGAEGHGPDTLVNPEPGSFILGSKSYGRNSQLLLRAGWEQVDPIFSLIAGEAPRAEVSD